MRYQILKNLENYKRGILRGLRGCLGFDLENELTIFEVNGSFTLNSILKQAAAAGVDPVNYQIAVITRPAAGYSRDEYTTFIIDENGKFENKINHCGYSNNNFVSLDTFYTKSDINDARKNALHTIIICQSRDLITAPCRNNPAPDLMQRFKLNKVNYYVKQYGGQEYINSLDIIPENSNGRAYEYKPGRGYSDEVNYTAFIDKSGYITSIRRADLVRRAAAITAAKKQAAYNATNNEAALAELKSQIENKKAAIIAELQAADNHEAINAIAKKLDFFRGLSDIYFQFELLQEKDNAKSLPSIDTFNKKVAAIKDTLNKI